MYDTMSRATKKQVAPYKVYVGNKIKIAEPSVSYAGKTTVANDTNVLSNILPLVSYAGKTTVANDTNVLSNILPLVSYAGETTVANDTNVLLLV